MKYFLIVFFSFCISIPIQAQSESKLQKTMFRIVENDLWGYIDINGKTVIEPQFAEAGYFVDDLAMVVKNGRFGFIDPKGTFVIPAKYDMGARFFDGAARMYINEKPHYIDTKGKLLFEHDFKEIHFFSDSGYAVVQTKDNYKGLIDRKGNIIIKPIYDTLIFFENDDVVIAIKEGKYYGVLDVEGNIVVPFEKYDTIDYFINGRAHVQHSSDEETGENDFDGFIDTTGKVVLKTKNQPWEFDYGEESFSENLGIVEFFKRNPDSISDWDERQKNTYKGIIDIKGNIIKKDTTWSEISSFSKSRAFVKNNTSDKFRIINTKGNYVGTNEFDQFAPNFRNEAPENFFENDEVYVAVDGSWGMINRNGEYTVPLSKVFRETNYDGFSQIGDYLVYYIENEDGYAYGFCNLKTNIIIPAKYTIINLDTLYDDLIHVEQNGKQFYINQKGNIVWQEKTTPNDGLKPFNILAMNRGYFYASSPSVDELNGFGGWGGSDHTFKKIKRKQKLPKDTFGISVDTESILPHFKEYKGYNLYIYNTSKDSIFFDAQDSRLYMNLQAKDTNGEWKDIEYLPSSWCGNSYHNLFLAKNSFWEFTIPKYEGALKTKLRAKLLYKTNHKDKESKVIYSNEFDGSVNPAQFWYKGSYTRSGIMDPYNN